MSLAFNGCNPAAVVCAVDDAPGTRTRKKDYVLAEVEEQEQVQTDKVHWREKSIECGKLSEVSKLKTCGTTARKSRTGVGTKEKG